MTDTVFDKAPSEAIADLNGTYAIDASHTRLGFTARHAMVTNVKGSFSDFEGTVSIDTANPANSTAEVTIQLASVSTGSADRDAHLRSGDFFDVEQYPTMTFRSTGVEDVDVAAGTFTLVGDLTIKDVTKPVRIDLTFDGSAKDPFGNYRAGFEGKAVVNRKDWNLTWNAALETGGVLVSEKIKLDFDVALVKNA
ncbi:YceI family protein [Aquipuribacter nitratireducens]|uniref:YceI family protein n=1 Tax=Aquipuribacter nitratireducens TaxID=650104 RepID=A0ABW0GT18_9MICO